MPVGQRILYGAFIWGFYVRDFIVIAYSLRHHLDWRSYRVGRCSSAQGAKTSLAWEIARVRVGVWKNSHASAYRANSNGYYARLSTAAWCRPVVWYEQPNCPCDCRQASIISIDCCLCHRCSVSCNTCLIVQKPGRYGLAYYPSHRIRHFICCGRCILSHRLVILTAQYKYSV